MKYDWVWYWIVPKWEYVQSEQQERTGTRTVEANTYSLGNMTINGGTNRRNITLVGTYFVYGDLFMQNVNLTADAIIYVQGKIDISNSTIQGVTNDSTLIVFGNGNVDMYNMSVNSTESGATKIIGFYYSKQDMIIYAVGSNLI